MKEGKSSLSSLLRWGDDELILGHRDSEWVGHAPILEEDIAFANIALDELGHAQLWYELYGERSGKHPDELVFFRDADSYLCAPLVELPKGDWAFTIVRQYLFDAFEAVQLGAMSKVSDTRVAQIAAKVRPEEIYHLRHTLNWVKRLGQGTDESNRRMQRALDELWVYALQLFEPLDAEGDELYPGVDVTAGDLREEWEGQVRGHLLASGLIVPAESHPLEFSRRRHTPYLAELLAEMQQVARSEPFGVEW